MKLRNLLGAIERKTFLSHKDLACSETMLNFDVFSP